MVKGSHHTEATKRKLRKAREKYKRDVVHGTNDGYVNHGCRCQPCTDARKAYTKFRREEKRIRDEAAA